MTHYSFMLTKKFFLIIYQMVSSPKVCFNSNLFLGSVVSLIIIMSIVVGTLLYFIPKASEERIKYLEEQSKRSQQPQQPQQPQPIIINRQRDSDRSYPTSVYIPENTDFSDFKNVGYIYNTTLRLPLYMSRIGNRYYYFTRDDSRNNIKIPMDKNGKYEEYYDGDTKLISELSSEIFTIKLYDDKTSIYNPFGINV